MQIQLIRDLKCICKISFATQYNNHRSNIDYIHILGYMQGAQIKQGRVHQEVDFLGAVLEF